MSKFDRFQEPKVEELECVRCDTVHERNEMSISEFYGGELCKECREEIDRNVDYCGRPND